MDGGAWWATVHGVTKSWTQLSPWTVAHQDSLLMEFSRQEYWSRLPFPSPGDLLDPGIKPTFLAPPTLAGGFYANVPPGNPTEIFQCITTKTKKSGVE